MHWSVLYSLYPHPAVREFPSRGEVRVYSSLLPLVHGPADRIPGDHDEMPGGVDGVILDQGEGREENHWEGVWFTVEEGVVTVEVGGGEYAVVPLPAAERCEDGVQCRGSPLGFFWQSDAT